MSEVSRLGGSFGEDNWNSDTLGEGPQRFGGDDLSIDEEIVILTDDDDSGGGGNDNSGGSSGSGNNGDSSGNRQSVVDNVDVNGLSFPALSGDIKAVLLALGSEQSEVAQSQIELTSEQIELFQADMKTELAKNVDKMSKMRDSAEKAEFWTDVAKYAGFAAAGLTALVGIATCNPVLVVAGVTMLTTMALNESGATEAMMDAMGPVVGTIVLAVVIIALSVATGGIAGLTMFTSLSTGLLVTPENLENLGMDSETAMWVALAMGIALSLISGFAMARMGTVGSQAVSVTDKAAGLSDDAANLADDAATLSQQAAGLGDDAAQLSDDATKLSDDAASLADDAANNTDDTAKLADDAANLADDATALADDAANTASKTTGAVSESAKELSEKAKEVARNAKKVAASVSKGRMGRFLESTRNGRLEQYMHGKFQKLSTSLNNMSGGSAVVTADTMAKLGAFSTISTGVVDLFTGALAAATTVFNYETSVYQADAELADAMYEYASGKEQEWTAMYTEFASSFESKIGTTAEAIATYHATTKGHQQFAI